MTKPAPKSPRQRAGGQTWKLEDAKARFSEIVRRAQDEGPQAVTVRGRRAVVILDAEAYERLAAPAPALPFVAFLESMHMDGLDLSREPDAGREVEL